MSQDQKEKQGNPLLLNGIYPDPKKAFLHQPKTIEEIKKTCLVFLDTNVLLLPYNTGKESLTSIKSIYTSLAKDSRLLLADRVMQEFETNVPDQLKRIFHAISLAQNINPPTIQLPLLEEINEYKTLKKIEAELIGKITEYRKAVQGTLSVIENWNHNDPVRQMYREVFETAPTASITSLDEENLLKEWERRLKNKIPPGYKDGGKEDTGIGDFLVWQAILDTCKEQDKDAILVSGEEKPDWWHTSNQHSLYPRRELVEEFRRVTGGKTIRLLKPSNFFELFGASKEAVQEIATEQVLSRRSNYYLRENPTATGFIYRAVATWLQGLISENVLLDCTSSSTYNLLTERVAYQIQIKHFLSIEEFRTDINSLTRPPPKILAGRETQSVVILASNDGALVSGKAWEYLTRARIPNGMVLLVGIVGDNDSFWPTFRSDENWPY